MFVRARASISEITLADRTLIWILALLAVSGWAAALCPRDAWMHVGNGLVVNEQTGEVRHADGRPLSVLAQYASSEGAGGQTLVPQPKHAACSPACTDELEFERAEN
jgi:hypothetical protein